MLLALAFFAYRGIDKTIVFGTACVCPVGFPLAAFAGQEAAVEGPV